MAASIDAIETILVDLPTIRPHKLAMTTMACQTLVIVRIHHSDGIVGLGEATTIGGLSYGPESPEGIKLTIDTYLAPLLIGESTVSLNALRARLDRHVKGNAFAKSALETALLDAEGQRLNLPVATLLGGARNAHLPVAWTLASGDTRRDIEEAEEHLATRRHRDFKLKIGARVLDDDIRHVSAIKTALGERASVRVDVNQAWDEASAARGITALEAAGIALIEQPIPAHQHAGLARLATRFIVPILADEAVNDAADGFTLAAMGAANAFALKLAKAGGPRGTLALAAVAEAAGIGLYGGTMLEGTIGTVASIHTFACLGELAWGTELFGPLLLKDDIVTQPLDYAEYGVALPTAPGLGVAIDEDKLAYYRRDRKQGASVLATASIA